jgi:serine/threonine protein kinase
MKLIRGGTLKSLIEEKNASGKGLDPKEASKIMRAIFSAITFIHSKGVVHRDLKPENILIKDKNDLSSVKLADFGLSAMVNQVSQGNKLRLNCGTLIYMAPEILKNAFYSKVVSIFLN